MLTQHASVIADSDVVDMCDRTLEAMDWFDHDRATFDAKAAAGHHWVRSRHSAELVRQRLSVAFDALTAPGSPSLLSESAVMQHYQAHGGATDPWNRARVTMRRVGRQMVDRFIARPGGTDGSDSTRQESHYLLP